DNFTRLFLENGEKLDELFILWGRPTAGVNVDEADAVGFRALSFGCNRALQFAAQVHNRSDADFFQLLDAPLIGLRTAIEKIIHFADEGKSVQMNLFGERRAGRMSGINRTNRPGTARKKERDERKN